MELYIECPHCRGLIEILRSEINCGIFRHGTFKNNNQQISPHAPEEYCKQILEQDLINGCAKPFQLVLVENEYHAKICGYI